MTRWEHASEIYALAEELGLGGSTPVTDILNYCHRRIDSWVAEAGGVKDIDALESLVTNKLHMVFEEVWSDQDWDRLREVYARGKREIVFAGIRTKFDDDDNLTYGALVERRYAKPTDPDRFVAIIDCRGSKAARRFFTRWHEIAHRLTTHADLFEPVYRSEHDPIERMMDEIAGHIGFYAPLFQPAFEKSVLNHPYLKFRSVESIVNEVFPTASFQATLFACTRRLHTPVVYLEATLAHKKEVKRRLAKPTLFDDDPPPGELRAVKVYSNVRAQQDGFSIPTNMRVPAASIIHRLFESEPTTSDEAHECLSYWESQGKSLQKRAAIVEARKLSDRVIAILQPLESKIVKPTCQANDLWTQEHMGS